MRSAIGIVAASLALSGCAHNSFTDRPATLSYTWDSLTPAMTEELAIAAYHNPADTRRNKLSQREFRDAFVRRQLAADEDEFNRFVRALRTQRAGFNIASDGAVLALNGVSAVTGGEATKAALAAISGGIVGLRGSIDKELFNQEALAALIAKMKSARLAALVPITAGLTFGTDLYPIEQAMIDLRAYANAGTLTGSLTAITTEAGAQSDKATRQIEGITRGAAYLATQDQRKILSERVGSLSNARVLLLVEEIEQDSALGGADAWKALAARADPKKARRINSDYARLFVRRWAIESQDRDLLDRLSMKLDSVERR